MREEISYAERALRAGARGYVTKRESTAKIVEAIREVRAGRIYASAEMMAGLTARIVGQSEPRAHDPLESLSDREIEVFRRLGTGQGTREIATELGLSLPPYRPIVRGLRRNSASPQATNSCARRCAGSKTSASQFLVVPRA